MSTNHRHRPLFFLGNRAERIRPQDQYIKCAVAPGGCFFGKSLETNEWHTVDGSEIRRSPVEVGRLSHYLHGFYTSQVVVWDVFHQQYDLTKHQLEVLRSCFEDSSTYSLPFWTNKFQLKVMLVWKSVLSATSIQMCWCFLGMFLLLSSWWFQPLRKTTPLKNISRQNGILSPNFGMNINKICELPKSQLFIPWSHRSLPFLWWGYIGAPTADNAASTTVAKDWRGRGSVQVRSWECGSTLRLCFMDVQLKPTPWKINMEHNHRGLEDHFPFF